MATHRSLNKLEFKAHMSIHSFVEVPDGELHESADFTRDRLGKKHLLKDESGQPRVGNLRKKAVIAALVLMFLGVGPVHAKGPNTQVSSGDPEVRSASEWMNDKDPKPTFYESGSTRVGFNDDGDPNVSTRF